MNDPESASDAFARLHTRMTALMSDEAFWAEQDARIAENQRKEQEETTAARDALLQRRLAEIPAVYLEKFDPQRSNLSQEIISECRRWESGSRNGIGLMGTSGLGKTRLLCAVLRRLKCSWLYLPASKLSLAVADQWKDDFGVSNRAEAVLEESRRVRVLFLDDIGDEKHTEAVSGEMKDLIEHRTSRGLPILWTSNLTEKQIREKHGERGAAIVRRLAEFSWTP